MRRLGGFALVVIAILIASRRKAPTRPAHARYLPDGTYIPEDAGMEV